jgi:hypothetical protein
MFRKLIAGTAMAGALALGVAGTAGAASTTATGSAGTGATAATLCARLPNVESRIHTYEGKVAASLPKAEAREAKAKAAGRTKLADAIAKRITRVQNRESKLNARLAKAEAKCGTSGSSGSSGNTGTITG